MKKLIKKLICKIFGHKYVYNFGWAPNRCKCSRCGEKWKTIQNPNYIPGKTSPLDEDLEIWVEDHSITVTYTPSKNEDEKYKDVIDGLAENIKKAIDEEIGKQLKKLVDEEIVKQWKIQYKKENGKFNG
jgi:recombinational DNA repair protein (RecF pathway)